MTDIDGLNKVQIRNALQIGDGYKVAAIYDPDGDSSFRIFKIGVDNTPFYPQVGNDGRVTMYGKNGTRKMKPSIAYHRQIRFTDKDPFTLRFNLDPIGYPNHESCKEGYIYHVDTPYDELKRDGTSFKMPDGKRINGPTTYIKMKYLYQKTLGKFKHFETVLLCPDFVKRWKNAGKRPKINKTCFNIVYHYKPNMVEHIIKIERLKYIQGDAKEFNNNYVLIDKAKHLPHENNVTKAFNRYDLYNGFNGKMCNKIIPAIHDEDLGEFPIMFRVLDFNGRSTTEKWVLLEDILRGNAYFRQALTTRSSTKYADLID